MDEPEDVEPQPEPQPWWQPPQSELPRLFPIGEMLGSSATAAIILTEARVYSAGVEFLIERRIRRGTLTDREWEQAQWSLHGGYHGRNDPDRLRYGLALGDGQHLVLDQAGTMFTEERPAAHTLSPTNGSGSGSERFYRYEDGLWLWPLPPSGPIEVVAQWPAQGIGESRVLLDSAPLLELARHVRAIWAD